MLSLNANIVIQSTEYDEKGFPSFLYSRKGVGSSRIRKFQIPKPFKLDNEEIFQFKKSFSRGEMVNIEFHPITYVLIKLNNIKFNKNISSELINEPNEQSLLINY